MSELKPFRAYRITKPVNVPSGPRPNVGDVVYIESFSNGHGKMVFSTAEEHVYRLPVSSSASNGLVLAKFITLPEKLKTRYRINSDGKRMTFNKGQVFQVVDQSSSLTMGTPLLCTTGGDDAMFSYVDKNGMGNTWQPRIKEMLRLAPMEAVVDSTSGIKVSLDYVKNNFAGCRPTFQGKLVFGEHMLSVVRKSQSGKCSVQEVSPGALPAIESLLRENLGSCSEAKMADAKTVIEAFVHFSLFDAGARTFGEAADRLTNLIKFDDQANQTKLAGRKSQSVPDLLGSQSNNSHHNNRRSPDHKRGTYRKLLQQQFGF
tara:strand:- start:268 stop:1218 length:951 start_codon:yes stop_codon:yes gene_type:complete